MSLHSLVVYLDGLYTRSRYISNRNYDSIAIIIGPLVGRLQTCELLQLATALFTGTPAQEQLYSTPTSWHTTKLLRSLCGGSVVQKVQKVQAWSRKQRVRLEGALGCAARQQIVHLPQTEGMAPLIICNHHRHIGKVHPFLTPAFIFSF